MTTQETLEFEDGLIIMKSKISGDRPDLQEIAGCVWSPSHQKNARSVFCVLGSTVESRGLALLVA